MKIVNVSAEFPNYSQKNNIVKPYESCNVTSMVMAISYRRYFFPAGQYDQPEDNLRAFIESLGRNPENHYDLSECTNLWMGRRVTEFSVSRKISLIFSELLNGRPVVLSGTFPGYPTRRPAPLGHIVCLVGAEWPDNSCDGLPDSIIIDDPYGNTLRDWQGSGNDVKLDYRKFIDWFKPAGDSDVKWGHFFK
jgi:hypothetical protein